jgi:hypothetical protein
MDDPEKRMEIKTDSDENVISCRKDDGTLVENVGIETNHLELTQQGISDFQQALKDAGFTPRGGGDWTDREVIELPEPESYSLLNLIITALPVSDGNIVNGHAIYYDKLGNYFKKECSIEIQGQSGRYFARTGGKGNYTIDFPDDIKFGSWVPQDSFHLKGCSKDVTRSLLPTSYKLAFPMMQFLKANPNRVLLNEENITETAATGARINDWPSDARCLPDGFPVEVYVNGEYWGLYSWQLKKHRKNYSMDKKDYTSFFLDADGWMSGINGIWEGTIRWTAIDIKGPKDLICMDGSEFDGDHPKELIDETSEYYDSSNKKHKGSATTKHLIEGFSTKYLEVKNLIANDDIIQAKEKFNEYFDYNACMLVYIYNCTMYNIDSIDKNTLWATYKGGKIAPMLWDLDYMYGEIWTGHKAEKPSSRLWKGGYATSLWPLKLFWELYSTQIKETYATLRDNKLIDIDTWENIVFGWNKRVGSETYERDIEKWPETPSYRKNYTDTEHWTELGGIIYSITDTYPLWDESKQYHTGDKCCLKLAGGVQVYLTYEAISDNIGCCPVTKFYELFPQVGGYYNSPKRMKKWMDKQIVLCDVENHYHLDNVLASFVAYNSTNPQYEINCVDMHITNPDNIGNPSAHIFIEGHITKYGSDAECYTYSIESGNETPRKNDKTYTNVMSAIESAAGQEVGVPSEDLYYIQARTKDIDYYKI